ncbi:MaoC/PaaZ C-terminal domain-containing protein [Sphaerisporangium sp. NPDC051011]|uniref:MaoC/PaaZ C-terminal domain-containing protein n=1 Tax=Sphaerisporangium sp. NPDC051011 TaxID=3155792 RepID=UPI0033D09A78
MNAAGAGPFVGQILPALEAPVLTRTVLALFAGASNDHNPIHIDIDVARAAGHRDVFAQGMLSMAFVGRCLTQWVPQHRILRLRARFTSISPVHARPTVTGQVISIEDGVATVELKVALADGTTTIAATADVALDEGSPCI